MGAGWGHPWGLASCKQLWPHQASCGPSGSTRGGGAKPRAGLSAAASRHFRTFHHPTYGSCYTFNTSWVAQRPGVTHGECRPGVGVGRGLLPACSHSQPPPGISLVLRAEQQDHLPLLSTEAGIKAMVHKHDHTPFLEHHGFSIRPGTETTIGIREVRRPPGADRGGAPTLPGGLRGRAVRWNWNCAVPLGRGAPAREPLQPLHSRRGGPGRAAAVQGLLHHAGAFGRGLVGGDRERKAGDRGWGTGGQDPREGWLPLEPQLRSPGCP